MKFTRQRRDLKLMSQEEKRAYWRAVARAAYYRNREKILARKREYYAKEVAA